MIDIREKHPKYFSWSYHAKLDQTVIRNIESVHSYMLLNKFIFFARTKMFADNLIVGKWSMYASPAVEKLFNWADENLDGRWGYSSEGHGSDDAYFYFQNEEDALKFILTYGCNQLKKINEST